MVFDRDYLLRSLAERQRECSDDELRVLDRVLAGMEQGREQYGPLDLARNTRDWIREARAELRDYLFYFAAHEVAADHFERERRTAEFRRAIADGLDELREIEPEASVALALPRGASTQELAVCACGHPITMHTEQLGCLAGSCVCMEKP